MDKMEIVSASGDNMQPPPPPPNPQGWVTSLAEGDKILAYHGALIYEAKVC